MNQHKQIRRLLAALLSVAVVMGWIPVMERASADIITVNMGSTSAMVTVTKIAAGQNNSIALKSDGTIIAWGKNIDGWAKPPEGLTGVVDIYAKDTTFMARKSNGTVVVWGSNSVGEATIPSGLTNVISMASAGKHTLVVSRMLAGFDSGKVIGWGLNGDGQSVVPSSAVDGGIAKVAAGAYYSMALKNDGTIIDWGSNGPGATSMPSELSNAATSNVAAIDAGIYYALALKKDGTVVAWGKEYNGNGILNVSGLTNIQAISANQMHALALTKEGTVVGWGENQDGQTNIPAGLKEVVAIAAGVSHSLALKSDGTVVGWGSQSVPGENVLNSLTVTGTAVVPPSTTFSSSTTEYQYDIDPGATSVTINAVLKDTTYSALYINGQRQTSGSPVAVSVPATGAVIKVQVVPYMKPQEAKTYTLTVSRDRVKPEVEFSSNGTAGATAVRTITTSVKVTDATSGVDPSTLKYVWSQSDSAPSSGWESFSLLASTKSAQFTYAGVDGNWYLYIRAKDYAGNSVEVRSDPFLIDNTAPALTVKMNKGAVTGVDYEEGTWSSQKVVITAEATDAISTSASLKYTLDGGKTWEDYTGSITIENEGIYTIIVQASDAIGNTSTVSRTVKITVGDLKLTVTKVKMTGGDYLSGDWTNSSVSVTATAETKEGQTIDSFTWSQKIGDVEVEKDEVYIQNNNIITFINDGMNSGEFKVTDSLGNSMSAPYAVNIDRTVPQVTFTPNGNATTARGASVTVTITDSGGSGLVESTLKYVWTQSAGEPESTDIWLPLDNGSTLTKEGVEGNWYLHIQGQDTAGNKVCRDDDTSCIKRDTTVTNVVSNAFVLDNSALNSTLGPDEATFDRKVSAQADVITEMMLNGNELQNIFNGSIELNQADTDYTVAGNTVAILKSYLASQPEGTTSLSLTFKFSGGADQTLKINIVDTTPTNSEINPDIASFDKNTLQQADVETTMTLHGNTLESISNGVTELESGTDYAVSDDKVTILQSYLAEQPLGTTSLTFTFSEGEVQTLILMIGDTTPSISTDTGSFDKKTSEQKDVETELTLNGNELKHIFNGSAELNLGTDYTMVANTGEDSTGEDYTDTYKVTILKSYLAEQPLGTTTLTFTFRTENELTLKIEVGDSREQELTPEIAIDFVNEKLTGFVDGGSYTIDGTSVTPVDGKLAIESYLGDTFAIVKKGDGTTADSAAQNMAVPARPSIPTATGVNPTTVGGEGKITGVTPAMEYQVAGDNTWTVVTGAEIANLVAGTYQVRVKATATSFKSGEQAVALTDSVPATHYTVTVNNGGTSASGSGEYAIGDPVSIQAGTRSGYSFNGWTSTDGVAFVDASSAATTFSMIAQNVTVTANWQMNSGSTGGSGGGSSSVAPSTPTITLDKQPSQPMIASVNLTATVDKDGIASAAITESQVKAMIDAVQNDARNKENAADGIGIACNVLFGAEVIGFNVEMEEGVLALLKQEGVKLLAASTTLVNFSFDQAAIQEMEAQSVGDVTIAAYPVSELSNAAKALIGSRPVFDLTVSYEKHDKSEHVTDFGTGTVALGISYTEASGEQKDDLYAVYVTKSGKPQLLIGSSYIDGKLTFNRNSLSTYGVGTPALAPEFSDTQRHWAKEDIEYVVSLGLIAGTSETTFSPNTAITRGDFLMALGQLSAVDVSEYTKSSFSDVSSTSSAMPYIEWAVRNKIVEGVGNNRFSPDSSITREQMAVMTERFTQATGHALPVNKQAVLFADGARISVWAKEAVKAIQQSGIVQGKDNNRYDPAGTATRGEAATILRRFVAYVID